MCYYCDHGSKGLQFDTLFESKTWWLINDKYLLTFFKCSTSSTSINASINQIFSNMQHFLSNMWPPPSSELYWHSYKSKNISSTLLALKYTYFLNVQKENWSPFTTTSKWKHTMKGTTLSKKMFFSLGAFWGQFFLISCSILINIYNEFWYKSL